MWHLYSIQEKKSFTLSGFDDKELNQSSGKTKEFLPKSNTAAVFTTCSTLILNNAHHVIEVFVSKHLHNEILQITLQKPRVKITLKVKQPNLVSRCANSCFLNFVSIQNVFCTDLKLTKFRADSKQ